MLLLIPPLIALCWACLRRRRLVAFEIAHMRGKLFAVAALLIDVGVARLATPGLVAALCTGLAGVFLLCCLYLNRRLQGIPLIALGVSLNLAAMIANGGFMPMDVATALAIGYHPGMAMPIGHHIPGSRDVLLLHQEQHLALLGDWLVLPSAFSILSRTAYSIGDILLSIGLGVLLVRAGRFPQGVPDRTHASIAGTLNLHNKLLSRCR